MISTQWRVSAFSLVGLDYPAVFQTAELLGIELIPSLFFKIKLLENKTLERAREEVKRGG
jgi:hypothetical protein